MGGIILIVKHWDELMDRFPILGRIGGVVAKGFGMIADGARVVARVASEGAKKFRNDILPGLVNVGKVMLGFGKLYIVPFVLAFKLVVRVVRELWDEMLAVVVTQIRFMVQIVETGLELMRDVFSIVFALLRGDWAGAWNGLKTLLSNLWENLGEIVQAGLEVIKARLRLGLEIVKLAFTLMWEGAKIAFNAGIDAIVAIAKTVGSLILTGLGNLGGLLVDAGKALVTGFFNAIKLWFDIVFTFYTFVPFRILAALGNLAGLLVDVGKDVMRGFLNGIKAGWEAVADFFADAPGKILGWMKMPFGIGSPSTVFAGIGADVMAGLAGGLSRGLVSVRELIAQLVATMLEAQPQLTLAMPGAPALATAADPFGGLNPFQQRGPSGAPITIEQVNIGPEATVDQIGVPEIRDGILAAIKRQGFEGQV